MQLIQIWNKYVFITFNFYTSELMKLTFWMTPDDNGEEIKSRMRGIIIVHERGEKSPNWLVKKGIKN